MIFAIDANRLYEEGQSCTLIRLNALCIHVDQFLTILLPYPTLLYPIASYLIVISIILSLSHSQVLGV
jgi:hypothetical protein